MKNPPQSWFIPIITLLMLGLLVVTAYYVKNRDKQPEGSLITQSQKPQPQLLTAEERKEKTGEVFATPITNNVAEIQIKSVLK